MPGMLEFVNVSPYFSAPGLIVKRHFSAGSAARVQFALPHDRFQAGGQLDEDAADFLNVIIRIYDVFVAQEVAKTEFVSFRFRLETSVKGPIFGSQLLG